MYEDIESCGWYFGSMTRRTAERMLLHPLTQDGDYIIRLSESGTHHFSMSVRDCNRVKHYGIKRSDGGGGFFIRPRHVFRNLKDLVHYYVKFPKGLCVPLRSPCIQRTNWEVEKSCVQLTALLGQGQFGEVWEGLWNNALPVAVKKLRPHGGATGNQDILIEADVMQRLHHRNLVELVAVCTLDEPNYIITELMVNGCLLNYLRNRGVHLSLGRLLDIGIQIASGMAYLESQNFIHRDLAARNVLVGENHVVKIADFGLARMLTDSVYDVNAGTRFPVKWTALEAIQYNKFTMKSDVWSFGILLFEIFSLGEQPYSNMSNEEAVHFVRRGCRMPSPRGCPKAIYTLMLHCWHQYPSKRPSFQKIQERLARVPR